MSIQSRYKWIVAGSVAIVSILIVAFLVPAIPGQPGKDELWLAEMVQVWGGRTIIHFGLVRAVELKGTGIRDKDMILLRASVARLKSPEALRVLDLSHTAIGDRGIRALEGLNERYLELYLNNTRITDDGLAMIGEGFQGLSVLKIENTEVTEEGLSSLASNPTLREVFVSGPQITEDTLNRLSERHKKSGIRFVLFKGKQRDSGDTNR